MKRMKRYKIKTEKPEASASHSRDSEEHDLAYYIHDRVDLMHQVFSILKYKEIKTMAPQSVRDLAVGDLQELCTEELLGISSKRLVAILDGAEPPSDTESSSQSTPERMETISLDSISSDEEILSQSSKKKKHKHSKSKSKRKRSKQKAKDTAEAKPDDTAEVSKASRAGLTVLELLELQARARAIRAQLQNEQHLKKQLEQTTAAGSSDDDDDAVEIKEETPDVVEISSGDEKPDVNTLQAQVQNTAKQKELRKSVEPQKAKEVPKQQETAKTKEASKKKEKAKKNSKQKVTTKRKENSEQKETSNTIDMENSMKEPENCTETGTKEASLIKSTITRIGGNPTEAEPEGASKIKSTVTKRVSDLIITVPHSLTSRKIKLNRHKVQQNIVTLPIEPEGNVAESRIGTIEKPKKLKKNKKKKNLEKDASDHDEITLQLSDSEKMDLLEDLNEKNYNKLSSSADSASSSSDSENDTSNENISNVPETGNEASETFSVTANEEETEKIRLTDNIEKEVDNVTEIAQSEIKVMTESNEQIVCELTKTPTEQSNIVETSNNDLDDDLNTNNKVQSIVLDKENGNNVDVNNTIVDNNQDVDDNLEKQTIPNNDASVSLIAISAEESNVNIITEIDNVSSIDITKSSDENMSEVQKDNEDQAQLEASKHMGLENIANQNKEKIRDRTTTEEDTETTQTETDKKDSISMVVISSIDNIPVNAEQNKKIDANVNQESVSDKGKEGNKDISEGEISDRESSEVEAFDMEPEVVCISDDDTQKSKKKKKKEKKAKKDKKSKKSKKDFRERADQNFYKDADKLTTTDIRAIDIADKHTNMDIKTIETIDGDENRTVTEAIDKTDDDVYEILELSDDSSCYEVEGTVLSKEPTAEEIAALSATIDDINEDNIESKDEEVIYDHTESGKDTKCDGNTSDESEKDTVMSWKERYLGSNKVKKVLTTANILNALRKKNKQLKKKMEVSKQTIKDTEIIQSTQENQVTAEITESNVTDDSKNTEINAVTEGSIEHYQTLPTLPKYVTTTENTETENTETEIETDITKEMKRDAKQLFKMYKKLMYSKKAKRSEKKRLRKVRKRIERDNLNESV